MDNATRRQLLEQTKQAQQEGFKGSVMDVYSNPQILQQQSPVAVANTPQQQSQGLRGVERQDAPQAMVFPNLAPNTPMNTKGMKFNVDMDMYDPKGHLMQSYKNVPPGVESLPTGPRGATVVERPTRQTGGSNVTTADSLLLYNKVQDLYSKLNNMRATSTGPIEGHRTQSLKNQSTWESKFGTYLQLLKKNLIKEKKLGNDGTIESSDYYDNINDKFYGTTDWLKGGGDDIDFPITYINQHIKPQAFQDNLIEEVDAQGNYSDRQVASYMYDPLVIKPDYLLTDEERAIRNHPYFKPNTQIQRPLLSSRIPNFIPPDSTPTPPAKNLSYAKAYLGVDKSEYPTLESFVEAATNYKKYGTNKKPDTKKPDTNKPIRFSKFSEDMVRNQTQNQTTPTIRKPKEKKYTNLYTLGNAKLFPDYDPSKQTFEEGAADYKKNYKKRGYQTGGYKRLPKY